MENMNSSDETETRRILSALPTESAEWIAEMVELIAIRDDIGGPFIENVVESDYRKRLESELHKVCLNKHLAGKAKIPMEHLDLICRLASHDVHALRVTRHAKDAGKLSLEQMRKLDFYATYHNYLEENQDLLMIGLLAAVDQREKASRETSLAPGQPEGLTTARKLKPEKMPSEIALDAETRAWMESQVVLVAFAQDLAGAPSVGLGAEDYVTHSFHSLRDLLQVAANNREIKSAVDLDGLARLMAMEAQAVRQLRQELETGKISKKQLKRNPRFKTYRGYFQPSGDMANILHHATAIGTAFNRFKNARGN
jgi:hypothetical protein